MFMQILRSQFGVSDYGISDFAFTFRFIYLYVVYKSGDRRTIDNFNYV
jgi:hypothetical protein